MSEKVIVFAPHPDDETLGCGGTIPKKNREGYDVGIVVMTDGSHALSAIFGIDSNPTPEELKRIRKEEITRAAAILGVSKKNLTFLDFEDGELRQNRIEAEKRVEKILKEALPVEIYFPYGKDFNRDHLATHDIILNSARKVSCSALTYQYSINQKYSRIGPIIDRLLNAFKHDMTAIDISEFLPLKRAAIGEFKSQISIISNAQEKPVLTKIDRYLKNREVFHVK